MAAFDHTRSLGAVYVPPHRGPYASEMTRPFKPFLLRRAEELMRLASRATGPQREDLAALALIYRGLHRLERVRS
jgi:hypothetical protein